MNPSLLLTQGTLPASPAVDCLSGLRRERTLVSETQLGDNSPWSKVVESARYSSSPGSQMVPADPELFLVFSF